jgi:hypothetical protein
LPISIARLAGTAVIDSMAGRPPETLVALVCQMRAVPKACLTNQSNPCL